MRPFPRSIDRGLIEAEQFSVQRSVEIEFPRSIDRGLIEARLRQSTRHAGLNHFRDQLIAASLKPTKLPNGTTVFNAFPRSIDRGLIEAATSTAGC